MISPMEKEYRILGVASISVLLVVFYYISTKIDITTVIVFNHLIFLFLIIYWVLNKFVSIFGLNDIAMVNTIKKRLELRIGEISVYHIILLFSSFLLFIGYFSNLSSSFLTLIYYVLGIGVVVMIPILYLWSRSQPTVPQSNNIRFMFYLIYLMIYMTTTISDFEIYYILGITIWEAAFVSIMLQILIPTKPSGKRSLWVNFKNMPIKFLIIVLPLQIVVFLPFIFGSLIRTLLSFYIFIPIWVFSLAVPLYFITRRIDLEDYIRVMKLLAIPIFLSVLSPFIYDDLYHSIAEDNQFLVIPIPSLPLVINRGFAFLMLLPITIFTAMEVVLFANSRYRISLLRSLQPDLYPNTTEDTYEPPQDREQDY